MLIRPMSMLDYDAVYTLWLHTPGMGLNATDDSREGIDRYIRRNPTTCFVAEVEGSIIGVILSGHDGRRGYIHHMAVDMASRRQGIGSTLLEQALSALKAEGITKVALVVFARNQLGNAFWEKHGFITRDDILYRNRELLTLQYIKT